MFSTKEILPVCPMPAKMNVEWSEKNNSTFASGRQAQTTTTGSDNTVSVHFLLTGNIRTSLR